MNDKFDFDKELKAASDWWESFKENPCGFSFENEPTPREPHDSSYLDDLEYEPSEGLLEIFKCIEEWERTK